MRKCVFLTSFLLVILSLNSYCQSPQAFKYQAVARNQAGEVIASQDVSLKISILSGTVDGAPVYIETHSIQTNQFGLINLEIGNGTLVSGDFSIIDWGNYSYFLKVEMDETGGTDYKHMGTTQLLSVPYALYAEHAGNVDDADADPQNELINSIILDGTTLKIIDASEKSVDLSPLKDGSGTDDQNLVVTGDILSIEDGTGSVDLSQYIEDEDADTTNELQNLTLNGNELSISKGNKVTLSGTVDLDSDPTNEIQDLQLNGNILTITLNGTPTQIDLGPYLDNKDEQDLSLSDNTLSLTGDASSVDLAKYIDNSDNQNLVLTGDVLSIEGGTGSVDLGDYMDDADADPNNEFQILSLSNDTIYLSDGGFIKLPFDQVIDNDNDPMNEYQLITISNDTIFLSNGGFIKLSESQDNDWYTSGDDIYRNTGNVGIGLSNPSEKLEINGNLKADTLKGDGSGITGITTTSQWSDAGDYIYANNSTNSFNVVVTDDAFVGIGTNSPQGELHVSNPSEFAGVTFTGTGLNDLIIDPSSYNGTGNTDYIVIVTNPGPTPNVIKWSNDNGSTWTENIDMAYAGIVVGNGVSIGFTNLSGHIYNDEWSFTVGESFMDGLVVKEGKVGIGTSNPDEKLTVDGIIKSTSGFKYSDGTFQSTAAKKVFRRIYKDKTVSTTTSKTTGDEVLHSYTIPGGTLSEELLIFVTGEVNSDYSYSLSYGQYILGGILKLYVNNTLIASGNSCDDDPPSHYQDADGIKPYNLINFVESFSNAEIDFTSDIEIIIYGANFRKEGLDDWIRNHAKYISMIIYGK